MAPLKAPASNNLLRAEALACATYNTRLAVLWSVRRGQHLAMHAELALVYLARRVHALALASELRLDKGAFDPWQSTKRNVISLAYLQVGSLVRMALSHSSRPG